MKPYARIITFAVSLASIGLLSSCHSSYQRDTDSQNKLELSNKSNDSLSTSKLLTSNSSTTQSTDSNWKKVTYTFDTSKSTNPDTGLPPISSVSIEGSNKTSKTSKKEDHTTNISSQSSTKNATQISTDEVQKQKVSTSTDVLSGIDSGIKIGFTVGIPLALFIVGLLIYKKYGKS